MTNIYFIMTLLFVSVSTVFAIRILKPLAPRFGLMDVNDYRKQHVGEIPLIGGIAMYLGVVLGSFLLLPYTWLSLSWLFTSAGVVVLGAWDDATDISVRTRLIIQAMMTFILSIGSGYYLMNIGNIFGIGDMNLGYIGYVVTALAVVGAINAFNMMDGIDGLAGMMAIVSFSSLALLFGLNGDNYGLIVSLLLVVVILPYLANNLLLPPFKHKIFMGDAGATLIGFTVVWLLIYGSQSPNTDISFRPVTALWIIAIPLIDMIAIMVRRIKRGQSPFLADRDHLHHLLMNAGLTPRKTLILMSAISAFTAITGVIGEVIKVPESDMLLGFLLLFVGYRYLVSYTCKLLKSQIS